MQISEDKLRYYIRSLLNEQGEERKGKARRTARRAARGSTRGMGKDAKSAEEVAADVKTAEAIAKGAWHDSGDGKKVMDTITTVLSFDNAEEQETALRNAASLVGGGNLGVAKGDLPEDDGTPEYLQFAEDKVIALAKKLDLPDMKDSLYLNNAKTIFKQAKEFSGSEDTRQEALDKFEIALKLARTDKAKSILEYNIALMHFQMGNNDESKEALKRAVDLGDIGPDGEEAPSAVLAKLEAGEEDPFPLPASDAKGTQAAKEAPAATDMGKYVENNKSYSYNYDVAAKAKTKKLGTLHMTVAHAGEGKSQGAVGKTFKFPVTHGLYKKIVGAEKPPLGKKAAVKPEAKGEAEAKDITVTFEGEEWTKSPHNNGAWENEEGLSIDTDDEDYDKLEALIPAPGESETKETPKKSKVDIRRERGPKEGDQVMYKGKNYTYAMYKLHKDGKNKPIWRAPRGSAANDSVPGKGAWEKGSQPERFKEMTAAWIERGTMKEGLLGRKGTLLTESQLRAHVRTVLLKMR